MDAVEAKKLEPYTDIVSQTNLMDQKPAPAAIVSEKTLPDLGVTDITLANGVRVIMKPTTFKKDEVVFSATSPGGNSLVTDADYPEAAVAASWIDNSGVGDLSETELTKLLSGKLVSVSPQIGRTGGGVLGERVARMTWKPRSSSCICMRRARAATTTSSRCCAISSRRA